MKSWMYWGLILGGASCGWQIVGYLLGLDTTRLDAQRYANGAALLLPILFIICSAREERRQHPATSTGGYVGNAVAVILMSCAVTIPFGWLYRHFINPGWLDYLVAHKRAALAAAGLAKGQIDAQLSIVRLFSSDLALILFALVGALVLGLVIGVPVGAVMARRRPRRDPQRSDAAAVAR